MVEQLPIAEQLKPFFEANPYSVLADLEFDGRKEPIIERPWNDESVILRVLNDLPELIETLNQLILPPRFSALWHRDTKDFEAIWTSFKLSPQSQEIADRKFTFTIGKRDYHCEFGDSSERLLVLSKSLIPVRSSDTHRRNMDSFAIYSLAKDPQIRANLDKPRSFWIRNFDWDEERMIDLAQHINFYMSYFDDRTTKVIVHPVPEVSAVKPQHRYIRDGFPKHIVGKTIDPNILHFWGAAHGADDQAKSFLYYYRLIEYAATTFLESSSRAVVRRLVAHPDALDNLDSLTDQLMLAAQSTKKEDEQRIVHLLEETLDRAVLWREIENNIDAFTGPTEFEGGFRLDPLVSQPGKIQQFDVGKFAKHTKDIRNALSHGRDIRTQQVIIPTQKNFNLLQPWITLMCVTAGQVILYKNL